MAENSSLSHLERTNGVDLVELSPAFREKFLWSPPFDDIMKPTFCLPSDDLTSTLSSLRFHQDTLREVQATASYAFSPAAQRNSSKETCITLHCPNEGCHMVIDTIVKLIAQQQEADIVVLDALDLALGEFGGIGKEVARTIDEVYSTKKQPSNTDSDSEADGDIVSSSTDTAKTVFYKHQRIFDAVVGIEPGPRPSKEGTAPTRRARRRIVYMRDFGSIACAAKPFMAHLLQALSTRRTSQFNQGTLRDGALQPTVLIMGIVKPPSNAEPDAIFDDDYSWGLSPCYRRATMTRTDGAALRAGGAALRRTLPSLDRLSLGLKSQIEAQPLSGLSAAFFIPLLASKPSQIETIRFTSYAYPKGITDEVPSDAPCICVFPQDFHKKTYRQIQRLAIQRRSDDVQRALMTVLLGMKGAVISESPRLTELDAHENGERISGEGGAHANTPLEIIKSLDTLNGQIPVPTALARIATTAVGLASSRSSDSSTGLQITWSEVSEAYQIFLNGSRALNDWIEREENPKDDDDEDEVEKVDGDADVDDQGKGEDGKDLQVEEVKPDEDLSGHDSEEEGEVEGEEDPLVVKVETDRRLDAHEKSLLRCVVKSRALVTTFEEVCIDPKIIESLKSTVFLPLLHPAAFKTGILAKEALTGALLYGPPGTGKTMVCRALARERGVRMLQVKPSDVLDQWVGESEKIVRAIFSLACRLAPCIVFIDEMDALFKRRSGDSKAWYANMLVEFMQEMDGLQTSQRNKEKGVIVIGATNRPFDLDDAILRRLPTRMMVDLPDERQREQILRVHLKDEKLDDDVNLAELASQTDCYSGSDLKNLCVSAAMASVKDAFGGLTLTLLKSESASMPQDQSNISDASNLTNGKAEPDPQNRVITLAHFIHALIEILPSSSGSRSELHGWHAKFSTSSCNLAKKPVNGEKEEKPGGAL